jgi:hypothetical protein
VQKALSAAVDQLHDSEGESGGEWLRFDRQLIMMLCFKAHCAVARADWLIGMNMSRAFSVKYIIRC